MVMLFLQCKRAVCQSATSERAFLLIALSKQFFSFGLTSYANKKAEQAVKAKRIPALLRVGASSTRFRRNS
jgi:hypothetical protein